MYMFRSVLLLNMSLLPCFKTNNENGSETKRAVDFVDNEEERREERLYINGGVELVYFACTTPDQGVINTLDSLTEATIQVNKYRFIFVKIYISQYYL
jgi:hypothetical protein